MTGVHPVATTGFGRGADVYAASRPGYPPEILDWLRGALGIERGSDVLEIGAGTGKFTSLLVDSGDRKSVV